MKRYRFERSGPLAIHASAIGIEFAASPWGVEWDAPIPAMFEQCGSTAVVTIRGPLTHHADWWCDSYDAIKTRCAAAFASPATTVVLRIASPGGDTSGCFETALELRALAETHGKALWAFGDGMVTSAAFAIACAADAIIAPAETLVGSVGVISCIFSLAELNKKDGLAVVVITSGERKADGNPNLPITAEACAAYQETVDGLAELFFKLVSERREISIDTVRGLQAGMFHGDKAMTAGLIDGIATWSEFLSLVAKGDIGGTAAKEQVRVDYKQIVEALRAAAAGDDKDEAEKAKAALKVMGEESEDGEDKKEEKDEGEEKKDEEKAKAEGGNEKKDEEKPAAKAAAKTSASTQAAVVVAADFESLRANVQQITVERMLDKRPDLAASTRTWLETQPVEVVKSFLDKAAKPSAPRKAQPTQGSPGAALLEGRERDEMDEGMGLRKVAASGPRRLDDGSFEMPVLTPSEIRARKSAQNGGAK